MSDLPAVPDDDSPSVFDAAGAVVDETSLRLTDPDVTWEDYEKLGAMLGQMNRACSWWVGDLIVYGEELFGHYHAQVEAVIGLAPQTIANRASVARKIPPSARRASLPFGVHAEVAYLDEKVRDRWLDRAELAAWTRAKLREEMRRALAAGDLTVLSESRRHELGLVDDLVVTGNHDVDAGGVPGMPSSDDVAHGEHPVTGMPAAQGDFLGEPVLGPTTCPNCGHRLR